MAKAKRRILLHAHAAGMFDGSYVIFTPDHLPPSNVQTPWANGDADDDVIKDAYKHVLQVRRCVWRFSFVHVLWWLMI